MYVVVKANNLADLENEVNKISVKNDYEREILGVSVGGILYLGGEYIQPVFIHEREIIQPISRHNDS